MAGRRTPRQLREDAWAIWHAGVAAVASDRLVQANIDVRHGQLRIVDHFLQLDSVRHICVVGAGKAGAGMAAGLEAALGDDVLQQQHLDGWVNVPADCVRPLRRIVLHPARPPGVNEPTEEGVRGCEEILRRVRGLDQRDLCICLLSGGGSALLPAPAPGVTLAQKLAVTQHLSAAGANIQQLNTVRKQLSQIKGGGLARACSAGQLITLIISDVLGDPLDVIASGPTVPDTTTARDAIEVLRRFPLEDREVAGAVLSYLEDRASGEPLPAPQAERRSLNFIIGNNAVAVDAAGREAERRGYAPATIAAQELEGEADAIGRQLAHMAQHMRQCPGPDCLVTGGEPTVTLIDPARRGLGGRNQQLALAALHELTTASQAAQPSSTLSPLEGIAILAGGTDGEDGPTDAAGAVIDSQIAQASDQRSLDIEDYLRRNDAYHFFGQLHGLLQTGPTHTNVCDLRVVVVDRVEHSG